MMVHFHSLLQCDENKTLQQTGNPNVPRQKKQKNYNLETWTYLTNPLFLLIIVRQYSCKHVEIAHLNNAKRFADVPCDGLRDKLGKLRAVSGSRLHGTARLFSLDCFPGQNGTWETKKSFESIHWLHCSASRFTVVLDSGAGLDENLSILL